MFICPEIDKSGMSAKALFNLYVLEKRIYTNESSIEGISADGDSGRWGLFRKGLDRDNQNRIIEPRWYAKNLTHQSGIGIPSSKKTIAEWASYTGIAIEKNFTDTNSFYWGAKDIWRLVSSYWFTILTPSGLYFAKPDGTGSDRGIILEKDIVIRMINDKTIDYDGETGADYTVRGNSIVVPETIDSTYKTMAINKEVAKQNYIIFNSPNIFSVCDYVRSYDGVKYVILSGRKVTKDLYQYTAVKEAKDSYSFSGADVSSADVFDAVNASMVRGVSGIPAERHLRISILGSISLNEGSYILINTANFGSLTEEWDVFNAYNPASGVWTVPRTGYYVLFLKLHLYENAEPSAFNHSTEIHFRISKNGSGYQQLWHRWFQRYAGQFQDSIVLYLTKDDSIDFYFWYNCSFSTGGLWNTSSGNSDDKAFDCQIWRIAE